MDPHDVAGAYQAKVAEYAIAVLYLFVFVPFWRFVNGPRRVAQAASGRVAAARASGWFDVPDGVLFHPGHGWVRADPEGLLAVGLDDFARKLVGPLTAVRLPVPGSVVAQGEKAWTLVADSRAVDMLSPVDGTVVAVNAAAADAPSAVEADPYGDGWLLKVRPWRMAANAKQLLSGELARRWMEGVGDALKGRLSPELGVLLQDGGQPVNGIAQELEPEDWDQVARAFLLS